MFATRRRRLDAEGRISLATVVVCVALAATFLGSLVTLGVTLYGRSVADARTMSVALQQFALRTATTAELAVETVETRLIARGMDGLAADQSMHSLLRVLAAKLPQASGILVLDATGVVVSSNFAFPAPPVDLSDRAWFIAQRDSHAGFAISGALVSRVTGGMVFVMAKAVQGASGKVLAVVNVAVPSDALTGAQALPESASGVVLSLMDKAGSLLARSDFPADLMGRPYAPAGSLRDGVTVTWSRAGDGRMAIEATVVEPRYGLVSRSSIPLMVVFAPLSLLSAVGLPLVIGMMIGTVTLARSLSRQQARTEQTSARLQVVLDAAHLGAWHLDVATGKSEMNARWAAILGHEADEIADSSDEWLQRLHPDERETVLAALDDVMTGRKPTLEVEHRLRHKDGHWVWVLDSGCVVDRDATGKPLVVTGTLLDISKRRETERRIQILMAEVDHRSKNLLAVVHSLINLMPPEDLPQYKAKLLGRIKALGHVHTLLSEAGWSGVDLSALVAVETAPFRSDTPPMIAASGPSLTLQPASAQAFAMVVHELMTNSAKYGALSSATGVVSLRWTAGTEQPGQLMLRWQESGGPPVQTPQRKGFGSGLLSALVAEQLDGRIETVWHAEGAGFTLTVPLAAITAKPRKPEPHPAQAASEGATAA